MFNSRANVFRKNHVAENPFVLAFSLYNRLASIVVQSSNCSWGGTWLLGYFILVLCLCSKAFFLCFLQPFLDIVLYIFKLTSAIGAQVNWVGFYRTISTFSFFGFSLVPVWTLRKTLGGSCGFLSDLKGYTENRHLHLMFCVL